VCSGRSARGRFTGALLLLLAGVGPCASAFPAEKGEPLTIAFDARPRSVDPRYVSTDANSQYLEPLLFLPLFGFTEESVPQGIVAESFAYTDAKTLLVRIREGIRFASGRHLSADDVVATYNFVLSAQPAGSLPPSPRRGTFARVASVSKVGERDVKFELSEPDASLISNLVIGILPKEALVRSPDEVFARQGFESGPFMLDRMTDSEWRLVRNEKFSGAPFGGAFPSAREIVFKILSDNNTRFAALLKGDVDLVQNSLDTDKVAELMKGRSGDFNVQLKTSDSTAFLAFNFKHKLFSDVRVRRAIALAINREEILKFTLQGMGKISNSMFPAGHAFHFDNPKPLNHNLREAELLLDAAGLTDPDGARTGQFRAEFSIKVPLNRERIAVAKGIAGQLRKVGLKVKVEVLEFSMFLKHLNEGNMQAWIAPWTGYKDGDHLHFVFHSSRVPPLGANRGTYVNHKLDQLLDKAKSESSLSVRQKLYKQAQEIIADDVPYVFLWHRVGHVVTRKSVAGFKIYPDGRYTSLSSTEKR
jgi:peptide/nickel transport system substrate-binding protein